jgi:hypothetical protein
MASEGSDITNSPWESESEPIVIAQPTETINNQNIGILITVKINKVNKRSEKVGKAQKHIKQVYYSMGNTYMVLQCGNKSDITKQTSKIT